MGVRRRNKLVLAFHSVLYCVPIVAMGWVLWHAEGRELPVGTAVTLAAMVVCLVGLCLWTISGGRRSFREMEEVLRNAGMDPDAVPEEPLSFFPRLLLATDRGELAAGILFLVLLGLTFVAYYAGWIDRMMGDPPRR